MGISHFEIFIIATFVLNITPGNDFIYVATQSVCRGTKAGVLSSTGISLGLLVHICASVFGLSMLLSKSMIAFDIIKLLGAVYLVYLGIKSFFSKSPGLDDAIQKNKLSANKLLRQGFLTNVFNPKVALFFLSFLPQFADSSSSNFSLQLLLLGGWFIFSGTIVNLCITLLFSKMRTFLFNLKIFWKVQQKITGIVFIGLGLKIALSENK